MLQRQTLRFIFFGSRRFLIAMPYYREKKNLTKTQILNYSIAIYLHYYARYTNGYA